MTGVMVNWSKGGMMEKLYNSWHNGNPGLQVYIAGVVFCVIFAILEIFLPHITIWRDLQLGAIGLSAGGFITSVLKETHYQTELQKMHKHYEDEAKRIRLHHWNIVVSNCPGRSIVKCDLMTTAIPWKVEMVDCTSCGVLDIVELAPHDH
jgi:hypothetical protein